MLHKGVLAVDPDIHSPRRNIDVGGTTISTFCPAVSIDRIRELAGQEVIVVTDFEGEILHLYPSDEELSIETYPVKQVHQYPPRFFDGDSDGRPFPSAEVTPSTGGLLYLVGPANPAIELSRVMQLTGMNMAQLLSKEGAQATVVTDRTGYIIDVQFA